MGQQPNIELEIADLPRPVPHPAPARRWKPVRPGDLNTPDAMPWGGAFGTIGPDSGYALRLLRERKLALGPGEDQHGADRVLAAVATARASHFGRGPIAQDVEVACLVFGLADEGLPPDVSARLAEERKRRFAGAGHDYETVRTAVASIPRELLIDTPDSIGRRLADGAWPVA